MRNTAVYEAAETGSEEAADTPAGIETIQGIINFFGISKRHSPHFSYSTIKTADPPHIRVKLKETPPKKIA